MALIVDTNQASKLPSGGKQDWVLSLSPYVMAEILLRKNPAPTLRLLRTFPFRLGLETLDIMIQLSTLSAKTIRVFKPFAEAQQRYPEHYRAIADAMNHVRPTHINWAKYIKKSHRQYMSTMLGNARTLRRRLRERGLSNVKHSTFSEALSEYASDTESFIGSVVVSSITNGGLRPIQTRPDELFEAVMENQYVGRFFRVKLAYILSISRVWKDQKLNQDPSPKRDDMTDITLLFYTGDGDLILSNDNYLSRLVALIEPKGSVKVCKVQDVV